MDENNSINCADLLLIKTGAGKIGFPDGYRFYLDVFIVEFSAQFIIQIAGDIFR